MLENNDKYILHHYGKEYPYILKSTPNGYVLVHDSPTPFGPPLGAVPYEEKDKYNFEKVCN